MGLDMYLSAKKHVSNYDFRPEEQKLNKQLKESLGLTHMNRDDSSVEVSINVGYWRKANAIHKWFVDNVQDGDDNCRAYYVSRETLEKLLATVNHVVETKDATDLPPTQGFFFGSDKVDDWYWEDMTDTQNMLKNILEDENLKEYEFEYQSSW
jgi:hypothetical protein